MPNPTPATPDQRAEKITVRGREAKIVKADNGFWIGHADSSAELYRDGEWRDDVRYGTDWWPTREAAEAFLETVRDPTTPREPKCPECEGVCTKCGYCGPIESDGSHPNCNYTASPLPPAPDPQGGEPMSDVADALKEFFALPNWENRGPEWRDIDSALQKLHTAWKLLHAPPTPAASPPPAAAVTGPSGTVLHELGNCRVLSDGGLACFDCGERYGGPRFPDLVIDDDAWSAISPTKNEGGLLCPNCICARLEAAGLSNVWARFRSGPIAGDCEYRQPVPAQPQAEASEGKTTDGVAYATVDWIRHLANEIQQTIRADIRKTCRQNANGRQAQLVEKWSNECPTEGYYFGTHWISEIIERHLKSLPSQPAEPAGRGQGEREADFQSRVKPWMDECFGPEISADKIERNHRFLEESLELVQANGCTEDEARQLVGYVFGRDSGEVNQEAGGVMVTLAALCLATNLDMHEAGETELARIWTKIDKIRAKQAEKPKHSPLPVAPAADGASEPQPQRDQPLGEVLSEPSCKGWWYAWDDEAEMWWPHYGGSTEDEFAAFKQFAARNRVGDGRWILWAVPDYSRIAPRRPESRVGEKRMTNEELSAALEHCKSDAGRDSCADLALRCHKAEAENVRLAALVERLRTALEDIVNGYDGWMHACDDPEDGCAESWQEYIVEGRAALLAALSPTPTNRGSE